MQVWEKALPYLPFHTWRDARFDAACCVLRAVMHGGSQGMRARGRVEAWSDGP